MANRAPQFFEVVDSVYRAALRPELWPDTLENISDLLSSGTSGLFVLNRASGTLPIAAFDPRGPASSVAEYPQYATRDDLRQFARKQPVGEVLDTAAFPSALLRRSETYHDFYQRWDLGQFVGTLVMNSGPLEASLVVYRGDNSGAYSDEELAIVHQLTPHIARSLEIWARLQHAEAIAEVVSDPMNCPKRGVVLLARGGRLVWMNDAARAVAGLADGIGVAGGRLVVTDPAGAAALQNFYDRQPVAAPMPIEVLRPSAKAPYRLLARTIGACEPTALPAVAEIMVVITDPDSARVTSRPPLGARYGLTPAETMVAEALAAGSTIRDVADERRISIQTVKSHLKRVMAKTDTHRQAELVRLLLSESAMTSAPEW